jgi:hypothetical protein
MLTASFGLAQLSTGSLSGVVTDPNGLLVAGARVVATHVPTGRNYETVSSDAGLYAFPNLDVGPYTVTVEQAGFKKLTRSGLVIAISSRSVLDLKLEIGEVSQTIEVTTEAPLLAPATSDLGTGFQPKFMRDAPVFGGGGLRNPEAFISYTPGVNNGSGDSSINGGNRRSKEVLVDGAGLTIPESGGVVFNFPSVEQFGEFKILTNNFQAEYGRTGGGIEIFTTASGGNQFHGTVFDYLQNSSLNANDWANNVAGRRKAKFRRNEFGVAAGGPVWVPKVYNGRNRSFFFFTYNGYRQNSAANPLFVTLPTAAERQGDFSALTDNTGKQIVIYDPVTGQPFPGNIIPQARFSTVSKNILPLIPVPTNAGQTQNYLGVNRSASTYDMWSIKGDHNFSDRNKISVWINYGNQETTPSGPLPDPLSSNAIIGSQKPINYRFNHDYTFRPNLLNHVTYGVTKQRQFFDSPNVGQGWPGKIGLKGVAEGETSSFPVIWFQGSRYEGFAQTGGVGALLNKTKGSQLNNTHHFRDDVSWIRGKHEFKTGIDLRWLNTTGRKLETGGADDAQVQGEFRFTNFQTASPAAPSTTGDAFASFLLGTANYANRVFNASFDKAYFGYRAFYFMDTWKVSSKLTLNLGLRYEVPIPRATEFDTFTSFDPNLTNPAAGGLKGALAYAGTGQGRTGRKRFGDLDYSSFGPRIGIAYALNEKTVLRGGYGTYYGAGNGLTGGFCLACSFGFSAMPELRSPDGFAPALNWDNGFVPPAGFTPPPFISPSFANGQGPWYISPDSGKAPRIHNWNFNIQREVGKFLIDAAYAASIGHRLSSFRDPLNALDPKYLSLGALLGQNISAPAVVAAGYTKPYPTFNGTLAQSLRPYPQFLDLPNEYNPIGRSWYHSFQAKVERRYSDLSLLLAYTFSKSLTDGTGTQTSGSPSGFNLQSQNPFNDAAEKSYLYSDRPHVLNLIWTYDLPFGKGKKFLGSSNGVVNRLTGGWTIAGVHQYMSGNLLPVNAPNTLSAGFFPRKRANVTGQEFRTSTGRGDLDPNNTNAKWINRDAFAIPGAFEFGNAANFYGTLRNPRFATENVSFIKRTTISETTNFEIRAEMFNILNRTDFGGINTDLTSPRFGLPGGPMVGARIIQMVAKFNF